MGWESGDNNPESITVLEGIMKRRRHVSISAGAATILLQLIAAQTQPSYAAPNTAFNPGSRGQTANQALNSSFNLGAKTVSLLGPAKNADIFVGHSRMQVLPGALLTPAELVAVNEVLNTGHQTLLIGSGGNAIGGRLNVSTDIGNSMSSLMIPHGVTAIENFATASSLNLSGDLTNAGKLYLLSTNPNVHTAIINAADIINESGATMSSSLPASLAASLGSKVNNLAVQLNASGNVLNAGNIISSGSLQIQAGGTITNATQAQSASSLPRIQAAADLSLVSANITNSGTINSVAGNINISSLTPGNIILNNSGGLLQASQGNINVRDAEFSAKNDFDLNGGSIVANNLNIYSGNGTVNIESSNVDSVLNIYAGIAHVDTQSANLKLGTMDLSGDPTFYNQNGNVTIDEPLNFAGQELAIVASGNITTGAGASVIDTQNGNGNGGDITLIAGAKFTLSPSNLPVSNLPSGGNGGDSSATDMLSITGASSTGGSINLGGANPITSLSSAAIGAAGNGGNITLAAFKGSGGSSGTIILPTAGSPVSSDGPGSAGNIFLIGAASSGTAIQAGGSFIAQGGTPAQNGSVTMTASTFKLNGMTIVDGAITNGSVTPLVTRASNIVVGGIGAGGQPGVGSVTLQANGSINLQGNINASGTVQVNAGSSLSIPSIQANTLLITTGNSTNSNITITQPVSATGTATIDAGGNGSITTGPTASISANLLFLGSVTGSIGTSSNNPLNILSTPSVFASTNGSAAMPGKSNVFITCSGPISIGTSGAGPGGTFQLVDTSTSSGSITVSGPISVSGGTVNLSSGSGPNDNITIASAINNFGGTVNLTINANSTGGFVETGSTPIGAKTLNLNSGAGSVGNLFGPILTNAQNINVTTPATQVVSLNNNGNMNLSLVNPVTSIFVTDAGSINVVGSLNASSILFLNATAGSISASSGSLQCPSLLLMASSSIGSASVPINTTTGTLNATATVGSVYLNNSGPVALTAAAGGTFQLVNFGDITVSSALAATNVNLQSSGNILVNANIGSNATFAQNVQLQVGGNGIISETAATIFANSLQVISGVATITLPTLTVRNMSFQTGTNASMTFTNSISANLNTSTMPGASGILIGTVNGNLTITGPVSADFVDLITAAGSNGSITVNSALGMQSGTVTALNADGSGNIVNGGNALLLGNSVILVSGTGNIGGGKALNVANGNVTANSGGASAAVGINSNSNLTISSNVMGSLDASANGNITFGGSSIAASSIQLTTNKGSNGSITVPTGFTLGTASSFVIATADGSGTILTSGTGSILTSQLALFSGTGNINVNVSAQQINQLSTSGTGFISVNNANASSTTVYNAASGGNFNLTSINGLTLSGSPGNPNAISTQGGSIVVNAVNGGIGITGSSTINATGTSANPGSVTLIAQSNTSGAITFQSNSALYADGSVNLQVGTASLGQGAAPASNFNPIGNANGLILYGITAGVVTSAPTNTVVSLGTASSNALVSFAAPNAAANAITLNGGVVIASTTFGHLTSLDLSNHAVATAVNAINAIAQTGEQLTVSAKGGATGGSATLDPWDLSATLTAFNIPQNTTLNLRGFFSQNSINIDISSASSTSQYVVKGTENIIQSNIPGFTSLPLTMVQTVNVVSGSSPVLVNIGTSGKITEGGGPSSEYQLTAQGGFTVSGAINCNGDISLISSPSTAQNMILSSNITSGSSNTNTINLQASGNIIQMGGKLVSSEVLFDSQANVGSAAKPINTTTGTLDVISGLNVFITNSSTTEIAELPFGNVTITSGGDITVGTSSGSAANVTLQPAASTKNMNIFVDTPLASGSGVVTLTAKGTGFIEDLAGGSTISGTSVKLAAGSGGIGTLAIPITTSVINNLSANSTGLSSIYLSNTDAGASATTLNASNAGNVFNLVNKGALTVSGAVNALNTNISITNNGSLTIGASIGISKSNSSTFLSASGFGTITMNPGSFRVLGNTISLGGNTEIGEIGDSFGGIIRTSGSNLEFASSGNVTLTNNSPQVAITSVFQNLGSFSMTSSGSVAIDANLTALGAMTLTATGNISANAAGNIGGSSVKLTSLTGSIQQAPNQFLQVTISGGQNTIAANAPGGSVNLDVSDNSTITVNASSAHNLFSLATFTPGAINLNAPVTAQTVSILDSSADVTINANIGSPSGSTTLITNGPGNIIDNSGMVLGASVRLSIGGVGETGSIGQSPAASIQVNTSNLTTTVSGSGSIYVENNAKSTMNLVNAQVGSGTLDIISNGSMNVTGPVSGGAGSTMFLTDINNGNVSIGAEITGGVGSQLSINLARVGNLSMLNNTIAPISVPTLMVATSSGNIGTSSLPLSTAASNLSVFNEGTGNVFNSNAAGVTVGGGGINTCQILSNGPITTFSNFTEPSLVLKTTANNAGIILTGNVGESGPSVTIIANGSGSITQAGGLVLAKTVSLISGSGDIGTTSSPIQVLESPVESLTQNLSAQSGGGSSVYLLTTLSGSTTMLGASSAGDTFQFTSSGAIVTTAAVSAPTVNLISGQNQNITIGGNIGQSSGTTTLNAGGNGIGSIVEKSGTIFGGSMTLIASGNIGSSSAQLKTAASNLTANANGNIAITNTLSGVNGLTVSGSSAGGNFNITALNGGANNIATPPVSLILNNVASSNQGSITAIANSGELLVEAGSSISTVNGNVTLQNTSNSNGSILVDTGATITALFQGKVSGKIPTAGGNVLAFIGSTIPKGVNTVAPSANVVQNLSGGGQIFYGKNNITAPTAMTINAEGANVTFSTGTRPASAITLNTGVTITADPPISSSGSALSVSTAPSAVYTSAARILSAGSTFTERNEPGGSFTGTAKAFNGTNAQNALAADALNGVSEQALISNPADLAKTGMLAESMKKQESSSVSKFAAVFNDESTDSSCGLQTHGYVQEGQNKNSLAEGGAALFYDSQASDFVHTLPNCKLSMKPGSLVYVDSDGETTSVLNLHDSGRKQVVVQVGDQSIELAPGQVLIVSARRAGSEFAEINPLETLTYRDVHQASSTGDKLVFQGEFSMITALTSLPQLKSLINSDKPEHVQIRQQLFKTVAAVSVVRPAVPFAQYKRIPLLSLGRL